MRSKRLTPWMLAALVVFAVGACSESDGGDTQTNWLMPCTSNADCGELSCLCQRCTLPCATAGDCRGAPVGTSCQSASGPSFEELCGVVDEPGLCLPACGLDDCAAGERCSEGRCVADPGTSSGGGGSSSSGGAGGSGASPDAGASDSPNAGAGGSIEGSGGTTAASGSGGTSTAGAPDAGAAGQTASGGATGADLGGSTTNLPNDGLGAPDDAVCEDEAGAGWLPMSTVGAPPGMVVPSLFFSGEELVVFANPVSFYDRCNDTWRAGPQAPVSASLGTAVEAAGQLFFFRMAGTTPEMVSFDYLRGTFSQVSTNGMPGANFTARLAAGPELLAWGGGVPREASAGYDGSSAGSLLADGFWRPVSADGAPTARVAPAAWTGSEVAIWGGRSADSLESEAGRMDCPAYDYPDCPIYADGALYDPVAETWRPMSPDGAPTARHSHILAWTGDRVLVWGGRATDPAVNPPMRTWLLDGGLYDPVGEEWTPTADAPALTISLDATSMLWTGERIALLQNGLYSGFLYDPRANAWAELAAPEGTSSCAATPIVQAGALVTSCYVQGIIGAVAVLLPGASSWQTYPLPAQVPQSPGILWTGRRLFVWGGQLPYTNPCVDPPPGVGCDPPPPTFVNTGWVLTL